MERGSGAGFASPATLAAPQALASLGYYAASDPFSDPGAVPWYRVTYCLDATVTSLAACAAKLVSGPARAGTAPPPAAPAAFAPSALKDFNGNPAAAKIAVRGLEF